MSTIGFADIYGLGTGLGRSPGTVAPGPAEETAGPSEDNKPAFMWVGMVVALVILRVLWEMS